MAKSTESNRVGKATATLVKPSKPRPDFPLFAHATRRWAKKIKGKLYYFGPWDDPQAALDNYLDQKDDLYAGRRPRASREGLNVRDLCNRFLTAKEGMVESDELVRRTWDDYKRATDRVVQVFGKSRLVADLGPDDFADLRTKMATTLGPVALGNEIQRTRVVFNFAIKNGLVDKPVVYGISFQRPSKKVLRKQRAKNGKRMFDAAEIRRMVDSASAQLKAMILLGINCGFGNADVGNLPLSALDLGDGWADYPRPKTGIARRCPLWKETVNAIHAAQVTRRKRQDETDGLAFVTKYGQKWAKESADNPVTKETRKLLDELEICRRGLGFYGLRHTFRTVADETRDQPAIDLIMGHARDDMASTYREHIADDRLRVVTDYVHDWLFTTEVNNC